MEVVRTYEKMKTLLTRDNVVELVKKKTLYGKMTITKDARRSFDDHL